MNRIIYFILIFILCGRAISHEDSKIEVAEDGKLQGLPNEYLPAYIDFRSLELKVKANIFKFPSCFSGLLTQSNMPNVSISSSWYHGGGLRNYIVFAFGPRRQAEYLFSLDSVKPLDWMGEIDHNKQGEEAFEVLTDQEMCNNLKYGT